MYQNEFAGLINYASFKSFLEAAFYKSEQFKQIKTLNVSKVSELDNTGILLKHETIVKDKFLLDKLLNKETGMERNVELNCIRSDWLLLTL